MSGDRAKPETASESTEDGKASWERRFGTFKREISLPKSADLQAISAKYASFLMQDRGLTDSLWQG